MAHYFDPDQMSQNVAPQKFSKEWWNEHPTLSVLFAQARSKNYDLFNQDDVALLQRSTKMEEEDKTDEEEECQQEFQGMTRTFDAYNVRHFLKKYYILGLLKGAIDDGVPLTPSEAIKVCRKLIIAHVKNKTNTTITVGESTIKEALVVFIIGPWALKVWFYLIQIHIIKNQFRYHLMNASKDFMVKLCRYARNVLLV